MEEIKKKYLYDSETIKKVKNHLEYNIYRATLIQYDGSKNSLIYNYTRKFIIEKDDEKFNDLKCAIILEYLIHVSIERHIHCDIEYSHEDLWNLDKEINEMSKNYERTLPIEYVKKITSFEEIDKEQDKILPKIIQSYEINHFL